MTVGRPSGETWIPQRPRNVPSTLMGEVCITPLRWPAWYLDASQTQRFLADIPFLGLYARVRRQIRGEIAKRSYRTIELWGTDIRRNRCVCIVSPIVMDCLNWPNSFFVPDDLCELLFWDRSPELLSVEAIYRIEKTLDLPADIARLGAEATYGDFIDRIVGHLSENLGNG